MSIHKFPGGEEIPEESIDHTKDAQDTETLGSASWSNDGIIRATTPENFNFNLYSAFIAKNLADSRIRKMPDNIFNIENGGLITALKKFPEAGIEVGNSTALFCDKTGVRFGNLDSFVVLPIETVVKLINDGVFEYRGSFLSQERG